MRKRKKKQRAQPLQTKSQPIRVSERLPPENDRDREPEEPPPLPWYLRD